MARDRESLQAPIWRRQRGEPAKRYRALELYIELGPGDRNLGKVAKAQGVAERTIKQWSSDDCWVERTDAHDLHSEALRQAEREKLDREQERVWADRRAKIREREFNAGQALLDQAQQMARTPIYEVQDTIVETYADGRSKTVIRKIVPTKWRASDIARFNEIGSKILRRSAEMESDRQVIEHNWSKDDIDRAVDAMTPEDRRAFLESTDAEQDKILARYLARTSRPRPRPGEGD